MDVRSSFGHHGRMDLDWSELAKEVRRTRLELGLTMEALAEEAGVSRMTVHSLEQAMERKRMPAALPKVESALKWPVGRAVAILQGRHVEARRAGSAGFPEELTRSIEHAVIATKGDVTAAEIQEMARRVLEDLRERGII